MKRALGSTLFMALAASAFAAAPAPVLAQSSSTDAWARYNAEKKSEFAAAGIEWFIPVLGHAYVGDTQRGVKPALVSAGGLGGIIAGAVVGGNGGGVLIGLGLLTYAGGRVWGIVSALETAQEHNAALKKRLNLSIAPAPNEHGVLVGLTLRF